MAYTREEIVGKVNAALEQPEKAYRRAVWNYSGPRGGERYTEIAAAELLKKDNLAKLRGIRPINRENYKTDSHESYAQNAKPENTNQVEKWMAKKLYGKTLRVIGKILDYETPLSSIKSDNAGEIDMFSYNKDSGETYIIELKKPGSSETLLRCILEVFTYWQTANKENLLRSFGIQGNPPRKAVMADESSRAYKDLTSEKCVSVRQLMKELRVDFCVLDDKGENIIEDKSRMWESL